jgi:hypothetical protein
MKRTRSHAMGTTLVLVLSAVVVGLLGPTASAASGTAVGTLSPSPVFAGTTTSYTFTLRTTSGQSSSFNLTAPSGWSIGSVDSSSQAGVTLVSGHIEGRGISASSSTTLTATFTATAPCATSASTTWGLIAKSGGGFTGSGFAVDSTGLSTPLSGNCTAAFTPGRGPTDSAFLNGTTPQNISSVAYTPAADAIQVIVKDAAGFARSGISVQLGFTANPTSALLSAPTVVSGSGTNGTGLAAFSPVTISRTGLNYKIQPNAGTGVTSFPSGFFGVYQEETPCDGSCTAHGNSSTIHSTVTANSQVGTLAVLVSGVAADGIDCAPTVPAGYDYKPVSTEVTVWQVTGTGSGTQTLAVLVDKSLIRGVLNRGSSHIDFCFLVEVPGKTFTDKFGVVTAGPGLLPDCGPGITNNCIMSEVGMNGGDRLITVTVDDGKGRP